MQEKNLYCDSVEEFSRRHTNNYFLYYHPEKNAKNVVVPYFYNTKLEEQFEAVFVEAQAQGFSVLIRVVDPLEAFRGH